MVLVVMVMVMVMVMVDDLIFIGVVCDVVGDVWCGL